MTDLTKINILKKSNCRPNLLLKLFPFLHVESVYVKTFYEFCNTRYFTIKKKESVVTILAIDI